MSEEIHCINGGCGNYGNYCDNVLVFFGVTTGCNCGSFGGVGGSAGDGRSGSMFAA